MAHLGNPKNGAVNGHYLWTDYTRLSTEHVTLLSPQSKVKLTAKSRNRATFQTHTLAKP